MSCPKLFITCDLAKDLKILCFIFVGSRGFHSFYISLIEEKIEGNIKSEKMNKDTKKV